MERRAKKGKKEAFINFWVRSSSSRQEKWEGDIDLFIGPYVLNVSLPVPAYESMYKYCLLESLVFLSLFVSIFNCPQK